MVLNSDQDKFELERIRRWKVNIKEIYITPYDMFDGFLQITIGGDYKVDSFEIPRKNKKFKQITGERGYTDCTEVIEDLRADSREKYKKEIDIEIRDSIIRLMKQNIIIEFWDYNKFRFNEFQGLAMIDLMKIINGSIYHSVIIEKKIDTVKKPICKVEFKIIFQEIWDFILTFEDWGASNVNYLFGKNDANGMRPGITFALKNNTSLVYNKDSKENSAYIYI